MPSAFHTVAPVWLSWNIFPERVSSSTKAPSPVGVTCTDVLTRYSSTDTLSVQRWVMGLREGAQPQFGSDLPSGVARSGLALSCSSQRARSSSACT